MSETHGMSRLNRIDNVETSCINLRLRHRTNKTQEVFMAPSSWDASDYISLVSLSPKDLKFNTHKSTSLLLADLYSQESDVGYEGFISGKRLVYFDRFGKRIKQCGNHLKFVDTEEGLKLADAKFCKCRFCSMCQWRRALKYRAKFLEALPVIQKTYPKHRWLFLTLTAKNCTIETLRSEIKHFNESFNRFVKLTGFPMIGYVKSVEVTRVYDCYHDDIYLGTHGTKWVIEWERRNKMPLRCEPTNIVHPHLHIVGLVPASYFSHGYINQESWTDRWQRSLRVDYKPIVHIKAVRPKSDNYLPAPDEFDSTKHPEATKMIAAICETLKYAVKDADLVGNRCEDPKVNSNWIKTLTEQLYKMRLVEYRGVLKEIGKKIESEVESTDLIHINNRDEEQVKSSLSVIYNFRWEKILKQYIWYELHSNDE